MLRLTILGIVIIMTLPAISQLPLETLIHFDKSFYVSGEVIWYKLYLPITWNEHEVAVQTTVLDQEGKVRDRFFIRTNGKNFISGYYKTPFDADSGIYEIQFSASEGPNNPEQLLAYYQIPIYNDLDKLSNPSLTQEGVDKPKELIDANDLSISIQPSIMPVKCRSELSVAVKVSDAAGKPSAGHASVSVKDAGLAGSAYGNMEIMNLPISYTIDPDNLQPQLYVRGNLTTAEGEPLQINVLGGYVGADEKIYYSKSNPEGAYLMNLPDFTGTKNIQYLGFQYECLDLRSEVEIPELKGEKTEFRYTPKLLEYLELSKMRKKIYQYFESFESAITTEEIIVEVNALKPDANYSVKEYESFKDLKSFFGELMTPLKFKLEKDSTYTASLYNPNGRIAKNTELNGPPLFIIDGKVTRDADWVARLPISAVETVDLFLDAPVLRSYYQAIGVSGIAKISTTLSNLKLPAADAGNIHKIVGLQANADFPALNSASFLAQPNQPFFRPQIFWKPDVMIDHGGRGDFRFFHSDDTGDFEIKVVFQAVDGRRAVTTYKYQVAF
ncbi:MAG: hypothetical protein HKN76_13480 [Saprospiraceae bacterium]|nr:hypothetical protein [Saprospiraceae bacterium]